MLRGFIRRRPVLTNGVLLSACRPYCVPAEGKTISMDTVWSLWNEGNLFSLSVGDLQAFLQSQNVDVGGEDKKTALVRRVEDLMSKEQPSLVRAEETAVASLFEGEGNSGAGDLYEEADLYGDWGVDAGLSNRKPLHDAVHISLSSNSPTAQSPLESRALQVLHEKSTPDVVMVRLDTSKLPGSLAGAEAYTYHQADAASTNRVRFCKAFNWGLTNMWNLGFEGNINVTFGRTLMNQKVQLFKRTVVPMWSVQKTFAQPHVARFISLAHERNTQGVTKFLRDNNFSVDQDATTSYLVAIRKTRDPIVLELNAELQPTNVLRAWDRNLVTHYIRLKMPDARFMLRGRAPLKKRTATPYFESEILRFKQDSVESVLAPELGDVQYVSERVISTWSKVTDCGLTLRVMQTKRTPLLTVKDVDQGERLEYEIDAALPAHQEGLDVDAMARTVFDHAVDLAAALEPGMVPFKANSVAALEDN